MTKKDLIVNLVDITNEPLRIMTEAVDQSFDTNHRNYRETIQEIMDMGIFVVLEHAKATFELNGISRACSHQIVRHRLTSIVQRSQRYVNEDDFDYIIPDSIEDTQEDRNIDNLKQKFVDGKFDDLYDNAFLFFGKTMSVLNKAYKELRDMGIPKEDARFVLPNACSTSMVITANLREWRHIIQIRGTRNAQWEIRNVVSKILEILKTHVPVVFNDLKVFKK